MRLDATVDAREFAARLQAVPDEALRVMALAATSIAKMGKKLMNEDIKRKFKHPTGATAQSIVTSIIGSEIRIGPRTPYAAFVNDGTRPHVIEPKTPGGLLVFKIGDRLIKTRRVQHPGFAGHHYIEHTRDALEPEIPTILEAALGRIQP